MEVTQKEKRKKKKEKKNMDRATTNKAHYGLAGNTKKNKFSAYFVVDCNAAV